MASANRGEEPRCRVDSWVEAHREGPKAKAQAGYQAANLDERGGWRELVSSGGEGEGRRRGRVPYSR